MGNYARYVAIKVAQAAVTVWLTYTASFIVINALPGDPITRYLTSMDAATPDAIDALRNYYAYDHSWFVRYFSQLAGLVQGDFGHSFRLGRPVIDEVGDAAASTLLLSALALAVALMLSTTLVIAATVGPRGSRRYRVARIIPGICSSLPPFWVGLVAITVFAVELGVMSLYPDGSVMSVLVPATVLGIAVLPPISEVALQRADEVLAEPYVDLARVRGAGPLRVLRHHVIRNIANPVLVVTGLTLSMLLAGAVVTETIFSRSGIGIVLLEAVTANDVPLVQGFVLMIAASVTLISLGIDSIQPLIDPRLIKESVTT